MAEIDQKPCYFLEWKGWLPVLELTLTLSGYTPYLNYALIYTALPPTLSSQKPRDLSPHPML